MDQEPRSIEQVHRTAALIHGACMAAVVMYGVASFILIRTSSASPPANMAFFRTLIWIAALVEFYFAVTSKGLVLKLLHPPSPSVSAETIELSKRVTAHIITCGLLEIPALLGLALTMLSRNFQDYYFLGFLSFIGLWIRFPK